MARPKYVSGDPSGSKAAYHRRNPEKLAQWIADNPEKIAEYKLRNKLKKYGLTPDEYRAMLLAQGNLCYICGKPETKIIKGTLASLAIDHNHDSGKVRKLLCLDCNWKLGQIENWPHLEAAMKYLEEHGA